MLVKNTKGMFILNQIALQVGEIDWWMLLQVGADFCRLNQFGADWFSLVQFDLACCRFG